MGMEVGEREIIYLWLHCHHQNDSCTKVGSDESHLNVSLTVRNKTVSQDSVHRSQLLKRKKSRSTFEKETDKRQNLLGSPPLIFWYSG